MADYLPWINVGAAYRRITGDTSRGDEDILPWISKDGGARDFAYSSPEPGAVSFQGKVNDGWVDNGKGGYSQVASKPVTPITPVDPSSPDRTPQIDPAYAAFQALQAQKTNKARGIKDSILGRRGEVDNLLADILGRIESSLGEAKGKRTGKFDRDNQDLVGTLDTSLPDAEKAFASLGLSNSTFSNDRSQDIRDSYERAHDDTKRAYGDDLAQFEQGANSQRASANTEADLARNKFNTIENTEANADNLQGLQQGKSSVEDMLTSFGGERNKIMNSSDALNKILGMQGDDKFGDVLNSFAGFAGGTPAPTASGTTASGLFNKDKKKDKTEVQANNPVGAASF